MSQLFQGNASDRPTFPRFQQLDLKSINIDFQIHTTRTDGRASVADIIQRGISRGLEAIAFTEHVRRDTDWFHDFHQEVRSAASRTSSLKIYVGCETKVLDLHGTLDVSEAILDQCDLVLGSVHRFPESLLNRQSRQLSAFEFAELECELAIGMLNRAPIDVLAHPGGMTIRKFGSFPEHLMRRIVEASLNRGIAIELNSSYLSDVKGLLNICREINPIVSIGSDAHELDELGRCRDLLRQLLT